MWRFSIKITNCPLNIRGHGHVTLISDNILETVQDRDMIRIQ